jgi:ABC-type dipeptide/oligopeptide/nickel transport system permease subunit
MNEKLYDLYTCFKISLKVFLIPSIIGIIIGVILGLKGDGVHIVTILSWIFSIGTWLASLGLFVCAIAYIKTDFLGDLNHQKQWRKYFYKFNLIGVIFWICIFMYVYLIIIDLIKYIIK